MREGEADEVVGMLERLQLVMAALAAADTVPDVADVVMAEVLPALGAAGGVLALTGDEHLEIVQADGYGVVAAQWPTMPLGAGLPLASAVRSGEPVWLASAAERYERYPESTGIGNVHEAVAVVPLRADGVVLGGLGLTFSDAREFSRDDRAFLLTVGQQCAIAIDRARLRDVDRTRAADAERVAERLRRMQNMTSALAGALTLLDVSHVINFEALPELDAPARGLWLIDQSTATLRLAPLTALSDPLEDRFGAIPLDSGLPAATIFRTREAIYCGTVAERDERFPDLRGTPTDTQSFAALPLVAEDEVLGVLALGFTEEQRFDADDRRFLVAIAGQCAQAVHRAQLYDREREVRQQAELDRRRTQELARALQTSLLPPTLPAVPGVELAARYHPALGGADVGGDFYDVFDTGGDWALVVGDVCGKGPEAAALTALARYTVRSVAMDIRPPALVLRKLNETLIHQQLNERFCTVAYGRVVPTVHGVRVTVCRAGHLAPMVVRADGAVEPIGAPGGLIGLFGDIRLWEETVQLNPGDAIVFYTDGVTEATDGTTEFGEGRLAEVLAGCAGLNAADLAERLELAVLEHGGHEPRDDVAILVARVPPIEPD
jgi:serine phosphatase RsbU (regulator of sigma subunit)